MNNAMNATEVTSPAPASEPAAVRTRTWLLLAAVLVLTFLAYSGTLRYEFVYDDGAQIVYNPTVQAWRFASRLFTEHVWSSQPNAPAVYYRPLFMFWCLVNFSLFHWNPVGWHLTTVLAHLAATGAVFLLARRLLRDPLSATLAALVFGLHPVHVESVAWISGVADPLMTVFFIASFLCYVNFCEPANVSPAAAQTPGIRWPWLAASFLLYALATLTKEPGIVLPLVVFAYEFLLGDQAHAPAADRWTNRLKRSLMWSAPYVVIAFLYLAQRLHVLKTFGHSRLQLPAIAIPLTWPSLLWFYAHKLAWPINLSPFYDTPYVTHVDMPHFIVPVLGLMGTAALFALWLRTRSRHSLPAEASQSSADAGVNDIPVALFAMVWIIAPLLPVLDIVSLEPREIAHDRYLYLPVAGFAMLVAMAVRGLRISRAELFGKPAVQVLAAVAIVAALGVATVKQSVFWANDLLLFYRGMRIAPTSESATNNLANALMERGYYDEGVRMHEQILRADPTYWMSHYNLANYYTKVGRLNEAEAHMFRAAQLNPTNPQPFLYLGIINLKNNHLHEAELNVREAIRIWPQGQGAHYVLGVILGQEGRLPEAKEELLRELALDSHQPKVQAELASVEKRIADQHR
jgi:tetratricopeptide (TPR) repeat protein